MKVLMTGGTGFLGRYILADLISHCEKIYLLIRKQSIEKAKVFFSQYENVVLITGDLDNMDVIEGSEEYKTLKEEIDTIVHVAAYYDIEGKISDCYINNVIGTQNLLYFANSCPELKDFHYVSTYAVSGDYKGTFYEDELDYSQSFPNNYSETKYFAEFQVKNWEFKPSLKRRIYRLGILVGDSVEGTMPKIDGPYYFTEFLIKHLDKLDLFNNLPIFPIPFSKNTLFPIIPVDHAKDYIIEGIVNNPSPLSSRTYHVIGMSSPTIQEFLEDCFDALGITAKPYPIPNSQLGPYIFEALGIPKELNHYGYSECIFDQRCFKEDLSSKRNSHYREFKESLFSPIKEKGRGS